MFLDYGRVVFSLFIIIFRFSWFVCSCDSVSVGFFGTVSFSFSRVGSSFLICCFWLVPLDVFWIVLSFDCVFWCISSISRSENHPYFYHCSNLIGKTLVCSLKTCTFLPDHYHSLLLPSLWRVAPKIAVLRKLIVSPGPCFAFWSLIVVVANIVIHIPEKRAANISRMTIDSLMFGIRRAPADHDTKACCLCPTFCNIEIGYFYHAILWLYLTQGLFLICAPDTEVTENSHIDCS